MPENKEPTVPYLTKEAWAILDTFEEFAREFGGETDRAAVILGGAKLDFMLYQILFAYLLPCKGSRDELLDGDSPLSTFSSRINLCHRLGIIDADFTRVLHIIRKIRNSFAHEVSGCNLELEPHKDRIAELVATIVRPNYLYLIKRLYFDEQRETAAYFKAALGYTLQRLVAVIKHTKQLNVVKVISLRMKKDVPDGIDEMLDGIREHYNNSL
jgi:hypothetical protein